MISSFIRCIDRLNPTKFSYPYLMVLAEKEAIVSNKASKAWRDKTKSKVKKLKLMPGAYHELTKEPNNHVLFEEALKFMGERLVATTAPAKPFGQFKQELVKYWRPRPMSKRVKLLLLLAWYILIGLIVAIARRKKNLLLSWPVQLFSK